MRIIFRKAGVSVKEDLSVPVILVNSILEGFM